MSPLSSFLVKGVNLLMGLRDRSHDSQKLVISKVGRNTSLLRRAGTFDRFIIFETWSLHEYDIKGFEIKIGDTVVDIGAQIGTFSVYAAQKAKRGKVFAYEPFLENYDILLKNKALNRLKNIKTFNLAVSDTKGKVSFYTSKLNSAAPSLIKFQGDHIKIKEKVSAVSLEDVFEKNKLKRIDFLKIDAEGSEYKIILGASKSTLQKVQKIVMEYHLIPGLKHKPKDIRSYLEKNGFTVKERRLPFFLEVGHIYAKRIIESR